MDGINEKIVTLLEENRSLFCGKPIAVDGVVDEAAFLNSSIKTVFLLKEVNVPDMENDWRTFLDFIREQTEAEKMYFTWPNVCLWMEALHRPDAVFADYVDENGAFHAKKLQRNLLEAAVVNIKKTAGAGSSNAGELEDAVSSYGHVICAEIEECIGPELVICGGTFEYAKKIFSPGKDSVKRLPSGAEYFEKKGIFYLQFVHPAWFSVSRNILFAYAKEVFADIRAVMKNKK